MFDFDLTRFPLLKVKQKHTQVKQMAMKVKRDAVIAMRIPVEVRDSLRVAAEKDGRSMSSYAVRVLSQHLKGLESAV